MMTLDEFKSWIKYFEEQSASTGGGGGTPPHAVSKDDWTNAAKALARASDGFATAATLMTGAATLDSAHKKDLDACREAFLDRKFDADDLERRAKVLGARADTPTYSVVEEAQIEAAEAWMRIARAEIRVREELAQITRAIAQAVDHEAERAHVQALLTLVKDAQAKETTAAVAKAAPAKKTATKDAATTGADPDESHDPATVGVAKEASKEVDKRLKELQAAIEKAMHEKFDIPPKPDPKEPTPVEQADDELRRCQGSLETALGHLGEISTLDEGTKAFYNDLDLLSELTLKARRKLDQVPRA